MMDKFSSWQPILDTNFWENSLKVSGKANFLQSSSFGNFHERLGNQVWRFGKIGNGRILSFSQVIKLKTKFTSFLYIPAGPILNEESDLGELISLLTEIGKREKVSFIRLDPRSEILEYKKFGLKLTKEFTQPSCSLILNLNKSLEQLKSGLSDSTRYNIGWVERQGVSVEISKNTQEIEIFLELLKETARRRRFNLYRNINYYREQFLEFAKNGAAKLFIARAPDKLNKEPLAASIVIYFADTVTYLHAASSSHHPKLRAPYLMQWKIIEDAKNSGYSIYDFWGVAKDDNPNDSWAGVTAFKKGFGGEKVCYHPPYDLPLNNKYYFDILVEKLRKPIKRVFFR